MSRLGKILYLIAVLSVLVFLATRFIVGGFIPALWVPFAMIFLSLLGAVFVDRRLYLEFLAMKTTKHGMNMGTMIGVVVIFLAALNFISIRHYMTFDFTEGKLNSLADQSIRLVKSLDSDMKVTFFYQEGSQEGERNRVYFQKLLKRYQDFSSKISLEFIEVNKRPDLAEQYGVKKGSGEVFVEYKGRRNRLNRIDEQEITGAIAKVTRDKGKTVYLVTGHGEGDLVNPNEPSGLLQLKNQLEGNSYQLKELALATKHEIPADADLVLVVGPKQRFLDFEMRALENYLKKGGSLFVAVDPHADHGLEGFLKEAGVQIKNNIIVSVTYTMTQPEVNPAFTPATEFSSTNSITKVFDRNSFVVFQMPQAIEAAAGVSGITFDGIVNTSENSFSYPDNRFEGQPTQGVFTLAGVTKGKFKDSSQEFQMVVIGDSDFLNNQLILANLNRDLFLNSVLTLAKEENLVSITPKEPVKTELRLTESSFYIFIIAFIIPLPLLLIGASGFLFYRRRNA